MNKTVLLAQRLKSRFMGKAGDKSDACASLVEPLGLAFGELLHPGSNFSKFPLYLRVVATLGDVQRQAV